MFLFKYVRALGDRVIYDSFTVGLHGFNLLAFQMRGHALVKFLTQIHTHPHTLTCILISVCMEFQTIIMLMQRQEEAVGKSSGSRFRSREP